MPEIIVKINVPKGPYCHHGKRANDGNCNVFGDNDKPNRKITDCVAAIKAAKEEK